MNGDQAMRVHSATLPAPEFPNPAFVKPVPLNQARVAIEQQIVDTIAPSTIRTWLRHDKIKPWRYHSWQHSTDPQLVANAVAHNPNGSAAELVFTGDGGALDFSVVDHGAGVAAADRERIFDRFARVDRVHGDSTGLGLSIVAAIAAAHHGSVRVTDTPGGGATFTLSVPRVAAMATASSNRAR